MKAERLIRIGAVIRVAGLCCAVVPGFLLASPQLIIDKTSFHFGSIGQGQAVTAEFRLENAGDEALVINRMEFSMPGMDARVKQRLEPGQKTVVKVSWDTSRLRREVEGRLTLHLNDPASRQLVLHLSGTVIPAVEFVPKPAFYFSQFVGERQIKVITLKNNQDSPLAIEGVKPSNDSFDYDISEIEAGSTYELTVSTRPGTRPGRYRETLTINTSDARYAQLRVEVNILVKPDVFVSDDVVDFGALSVSRLKADSSALDFVQQTLVISRRAGLMRLTSLTTGIPFLTLHSSPQNPANSFLLEIGIDPSKMEMGQIKGAIQVRTDDSAYPELVIPVTGFITD